MGKEASGVWGQLSEGESEGKLLWEPPKLIFRGAYRGIYQGHDSGDKVVDMLVTLDYSATIFKPWLSVTV